MKLDRGARGFQKLPASLGQTSTGLALFVRLRLLFKGSDRALSTRQGEHLADCTFSEISSGSRKTVYNDSALLGTFEEEAQLVFLHLRFCIGFG